MKQSIYSSGVKYLCWLLFCAGSFPGDAQSVGNAQSARPSQPDGNAQPARVSQSDGGDIRLYLPTMAAAREVYGAQRLEKALRSAGYTVHLATANNPTETNHPAEAAHPAADHRLQPGGAQSGWSIRIGLWEAASSKALSNEASSGKTLSGKAPGKEGFVLTVQNKQIDIEGADPSGVLYGCLALADSVTARGKLPSVLSVTDQPEMPFRATCIGLQKPAYLPGRSAYEYPYTPQTFPWLYDKQLWIKYLDMLVADRMNALCLWNGHPFASLVRVKDYPYAVEVDDTTLQKNRDIFRFLTEEADKRGIWIIQSFYNIIVSKPFAERNHLKTQDRDRHIVPLIADYTRKSIAAFVEQYPNVGLMVTLGEAMEGVGPDDVEWFTKTIIPGIKDGLAALGKKEEPPLILRAHDTDAPADVKAALPLYKNLYTEAKFNGEALTTYEPRGPWAELHRTLSRGGTIQIENVHILANLEPFRYGADDFIQKCVQGMHNIYLANGLHLYPQASYWDWPYSADSVSAQPVGSARLLEMDRDWIWYKEWARYAWNCHRDRAAEVTYWSGLLAKMYGCDEGHGKDILEAYEQSGEIAPKLLRRYGITDGNRQTLTLGMFMSQLIDPYKFGLFELLYNSEGPEGEMLIQYAEKESKHEPHIGETPVQVAMEVRASGKAAVAAIDRASEGVTANRAEFDRLKNDMYCYDALANFYANKATAAIHVLRYKYSNDVRDLEDALPFLKKSVDDYRQLADLTRGAYLYANSMQTGQRKIPIRGAGAKYKTWVEMLPLYQKELETFEKNVDSLRAVNAAIGSKAAANAMSPNAIAGSKAAANAMSPNAIAGSEAAANAMSPNATAGSKAAANAAVPSAAGSNAAPSPNAAPLPNAPVTILSGGQGTYIVGKDASPFADTVLQIKAVAGELEGLKGVQLSRAAQITGGTRITFTSNTPVKVLVGFFVSKAPGYLRQPELETNASANDYGQADIRIGSAVELPDQPSVNIHSYTFPAGQNTLVLGNGACLVLGFIADAQPIRTYNAGLSEPGAKDIDWLFEN
jgi:hypothetical protein